MLPKLPPVLCRKLEEIRKTGASTLSKKQLLKAGYEDIDRASTYTNDRKFQPDHDDSTRSAKVAPEPTEPHQTFSDKDNHNAEDNKKDLQDEDEETEDEVEEVEECRRFSCVEGTHTRPRSPSFRFYVSGSLHVKEDDNASKDDYMNKGWLSDNDVDAAEIVESRKPTEEPAGTEIKKRSGRKGMKFSRVIPKGKPVRKLLNVTSCFYPSCGGQEIFRRRRLRNAKSETT